MVFGFCSIGGYCYSGLWVVGFESTCTVLFQDFMDGYIKFFTPPLLVELRVPNQRDSQSAGFQSVAIIAGSKSAGTVVQILWVGTF